MDFIDKIRELSARIPKQLDHIQTEEATKNALVMPFINALGYNVFDPTEVTPELCADVGVKKGEKVDYALFECKHHAADLGNMHASHLHRYFSVVEARFIALTNGLVYWLDTDLEASN
jgi:predicted type IV restriction endonuclease